MGVLSLIALRLHSFRVAAAAIMVVLLLPVAAAVPEPLVPELQQGLDFYASKKWSKAFKLLKPLAEAGVPEAQAPVGQMYLDGKGTTRDEARGREFLDKAAGRQTASVKFILGKHYLTESRKTDEGIHALMEAAEAGSVAAMELLGRAFLGDYNVEPSRSQSLKWYERAIKSGSQDPIAYYHVGMELVSGDGLTHDPVRGAQLLRVAAELGDLYAQTELAMLYAQGDGVAIDPTKAEALLTDAVAKGHVPAMIPLGDAYQRRNEIAKAVRCYGAVLMVAHDVGNEQLMKEAFGKLLPYSIAGHLGVEIDPDRHGVCEFEPSDLFRTLLTDYFRGR